MSHRLACLLAGMVFSLAVATSAAPAPDEQQVFERGDAKYRKGQLGDACRELSAFIQGHPSSALLREARLKRSIACVSASSNDDRRRAISELHLLAEDGPDDWIHAFAAAALVEKGDLAGAKDYEARWRAALDRLAPIAASKDPRAAEARQRLLGLGLSAIQNSTFADFEGFATRLLAVELTPSEKAHVLYERAQRLLRDPKRGGEAEEELLALGEASTDWADLALIRLGQLAQGRGQLERAVECFSAAIARKGPHAAGAHSYLNAITQPSLAIAVSYVELPGAKPEATISFRNVTRVKLTLYRADPTSANPRKYFEGEVDSAQLIKRGAAVRSWPVEVQAPSKYSPGTHKLVLDSPAPGAYLLEARAGELSSVSLLHVTPYASVLKISPGEALVWLADAMTGQAVGGGRAVAFTQVDDGETVRVGRAEASCDADGLCRLAVPKKVSRVAVWAGKGGAWTFAASDGSWWEAPERELLAYVLTDRPLYKPADKVGVKIFLRSRGQGPSRPIPGRPLRVVTVDGAGQELDRRVVRPNRFGTASFELKLEKEAALGEYQITVENPNEEEDVYLNQGGGPFRVEEYKPPEFLVGVETLGKPRPGEPVRVRISASLYAGGPIANAEGMAQVTARQWGHEFGPWPGEPGQEWGFGCSGIRGDDCGGLGDLGRYDDGDDGPRRSAPIGPGRIGGKAPRATCFQWGPRSIPFRTGEDGTAELEIEPACADAPEHALDVAVLVTDLSRREVEGGGEVHVSSEPWFVDMKTDRFLYRPGEKILVSLRAEDANGRPESPTVQVRLVRVDGKEDPEVLRKDVTVTGGRIEAALDADALGPVRIEVRPQGADPKVDGELASADLWLTSDTRPLVPPWDGMFLLTDQRPARAGSTLRVLVVAARPGGHALVTVEGAKVHLAKVVELKGRARFIELPLTGAMTPNVALAVSRFERLEHQMDARELQVFGVEAPLEVQVKPAGASTLPGSAMPVDIRLRGAPAGTAAEVAFSVVDEAIFAIAPEQTDLLAFFAAGNQEYRVQTVSSLDEMGYRPLPPEPQLAATSEQERPAYLDASGGGLPGGGSRGEAKSSAGGGMKRDGDFAPRPSAAAAKPPSAPAMGDRSSKQTASAPPVRAPAPVRVRRSFGSSGGWFPNLEGSLGGSARAQARFSDSLSRWKLTAYAVTPSGHLGVGSAIVQTQQPLMVRLQGPRFFTERDEVVLSAVVTSRLPRASAVDVTFEVPGLKPLGPATKRVTVAPGGEARVDVRYAVLATGPRRFRATARAAGAADATEWTLPANLHGVPQRTAFAGQLGDRFGFEVKLPEKRSRSGTRLAVTVSPSFLGVMLDALPYLAEYPYGCVEQTLSRFVPAVAASRVVHKLGAPAHRVPKGLDQMVEAGLQRLYGFQHPDGGWGWWQTDSTDARMTAYVVFGLALAKDAGVKVDPAVIARGRAWLLGALEKAEGPDALAFATFALAASGEASRKALDAAYALRPKMTDQGRAFTALALATAKDPRSREALESLEVLFAAVKTGVSGNRVAEIWDSVAGVEITALALMAAGRRDPSDPRVQTLADFLVLRRKGDRWSTTRDSAFAVYALADVAVQSRSKLADGKLRLLINGKQVAQASYQSGGAVGQTLVAGDASFRLGANRVEVVHQGSERGHWAAIFEVLDVEENVKARPDPAVEVVRRYTVLGRPGGEKVFVPMEYGMPVDSGERVRVDLEVKVKSPLEYVLIEDWKPAGLEVVSQRSGPELCGHRCTHAELRADRVAFFARHLAVGTHPFSYELRAEVPGRFHGLPTRVEAMYAPEVLATGDEMRVEVRDAPKAAEGVAKQ